MAGDFEPGGIQTFISGIQSSARRLKTNIDAIVQKYNKPFVDDDEINLFTLSVQKDKGSLRKLRGCYKLGTAQLRSTKRKDDLLRIQIDGNTPSIDANASMAIQRQYNCYLRKPDNRDDEPSDAETLDSVSSDEEGADSDDSEDFESGNEEDLEDFIGGKISVISESETELDNERETEQVRKSGNVQSDKDRRVNTKGTGQINDNERGQGNESRRENVNKANRVLLKSMRGLTDENGGVAKESKRVQLQSGGDLANVSGRVRSLSGRYLANESRNAQPQSGRELANKGSSVRSPSGRDLANGNAQPRSGRELANGNAQPRSGRELANGNAQPRSGRELANGNAQPRSGRELANGNAQPRSGRELANESGNAQPLSGRELANKSRSVQSPSGRDLANGNAQPRSGRELAKESGNAQPQSGRELANKGRSVRSPSGRDLANGNAQPRSGSELNNGRSLRSPRGRDLANENGNAQPRSGRELANKGRRVQLQSRSELVAVSGKVQHQNGRDLATESGSIQHQSGRELTNESGRVQPETRRELAGESGSQQLNGREELAGESGSQLNGRGELAGEGGSQLIGRRELAGEGGSQLNGRGELAGEGGSQLIGRREVANKSRSVQLKNERELPIENGKDHVAKGGKTHSNIREEVKRSDEQVSNSLVRENGQGSNCVGVTRSSDNCFNTSCLDSSTSSTLRNLSFVSYQSPKPAIKETFIKKHASIPSGNKHSTISHNVHSEPNETFVIDKASRSPVKPGELDVSTHFSCSSPNSRKSGHALQRTKSILGCENLQKDYSVNMNTTYIKSDSSSLASRCENTISDSQSGSNSRKPHHGWRTKLSTSVNWEADHSVNVDATLKESGLYSFSSRCKDPVCESQASLSSDIEGYERSFSQLHLSSTSSTGQFEDVPPRTTRHITASSNLGQESTSSKNNVKKLSALLFRNLQAVNMDVTYDKSEMFTASNKREGPVSESQVSLSSYIERDERPFSEFKLSSASAIGRCKELSQRATRSATASHNMDTEHPNSNNRMTTDKKSANDVKQLNASHFRNLPAGCSVNMDVTYEKSEMFSASSRRECPVSESQVSFSSATERCERPFSEFSTTLGSQRCEDVSQRTRSVSRSLQTDCPSSVNRISTNIVQKSKFCNKSLTDQSKTINLTSEKVSYVHSPRKSKNHATQRCLSNARSKPSKVSPRKKSATSFPVQFIDFSSSSSRKSAVGCQNWHNDFSSETVSISETANNSTHEYNLRSKTSGNVQEESANQSLRDFSLTSSLRNLNIHSSTALVLSPYSNLASQRTNLTPSQSKLASQRRNFTSPASKLTLSSDLAFPLSNLGSPSSNLNSPRSKVASPRSKLSSQPSKLSSPHSKVTSPGYKVASPRSKLSSPQSNLAFPPCKAIPSNLTFSCSNFAFPHSKAESPSVVSAPSHFSMVSSPSSLESPFFNTVAQYSNSSSPSSTLAPQQTHLTTLCSSVSTQHNSSKRWIPHATLESPNEHVENLVKCGLYVESPNRVQKGVQTELQCQNQCCCHRFLLQHGFNQDKWTSPRCQIRPNQSSQNPACGRLKRKAPGSFTSDYFTDISTSPKRMQTCSGARLDTGLVVNTPPTVVTKCLSEPIYHRQDYACWSELCCLHGNHLTASQKQTSGPTVYIPSGCISNQEVSSESVDRRFAIAKKQRRSQTASFANHSSSHQDPVEDNWICLSHRTFRENSCYHSPSRTDSRECDWGKSLSCRNNHEVPVEVSPQITDSRVCEWVQASRGTTNPNAPRYASCFPKMQQNQLEHCSLSQLAASRKANHVPSPQRAGSGASHVPCCFKTTQTENQNTGFEDRIRNSAECSSHTHPSPRHISANKTSVEKQVHAVWKEIQAERYSADTQSGHLGGRQKENYVSGFSESCCRKSNNEADGRLDETVSQRLDESVGRRLDKSVSRRLDESVSRRLDESVDQRLDESVGRRLDESVDQRLDESEDLNEVKNRSKQTSGLRAPMISTFLSRSNTTAVELPSFVENHSPSPKFKVPKAQPPRLQVNPQKSMFPESFLEQFSPLNPARRDSDQSAVADKQNSPPGLKSGEKSKPNSRHVYKQRSCGVTYKRDSEKMPGNRASTPVRTVDRLPEFCLDDTVSTIISSVSVPANKRSCDVKNRASPELTHSDDTLLADSDSFEEIDLL